jgi:hypothetical protein
MLRQPLPLLYPQKRMSLTAVYLSDHALGQATSGSAECTGLQGQIPLQATTYDIGLQAYGLCFRSWVSRNEPQLGASYGEICFEQPREYRGLEGDRFSLHVAISEGGLGSSSR